MFEMEMDLYGDFTQHLQQTVGTEGGQYSLLLLLQNVLPYEFFLPDHA